MHSLHYCSCSDTNVDLRAFSLLIHALQLIFEFSFFKEIKLISENNRSCLSTYSLKLLCALLPFEGFFLFHQTFLSTFIYPYTSLSRRYHPLPFFLPSVTSVLNCYSFQNRLVLCYYEEASLNLFSRSEGCAFLFFTFPWVLPPLFLLACKSIPSGLYNSKQLGTKCKFADLCK